MQISDEEYEAIIHELAERVRDVVFMNAERNLRNALPKDRVEQLLDMPGYQPIDIEHHIEFTVDDLRQILGRCRRSSHEVNHR